MNHTRAVRDFEMCALHSGGEKLEEIGLRYGICRERVRQVLKAHGLWSQGLHRDDPLKAVALVATCRSVKEIAKKLGTHEGAVARVLRALAPMAVEELAAYRHEAARERCVGKYRALAQKLGRVPTAKNMIAHGVWFSYIHFFGNFAGLRRAAGLAEGIGRRHLTPEERKEIARRYAPGSSYYPGNSRQLMAEFGVSAQTIINCRRRPVL